MISPKLFVTDTNSIVAYFHSIFKTNLILSKKAIRIFNDAMSSRESFTKLSIPSVVFVEIFEIWLRNEEFARKFFYEVFIPIIESPNIEIKPIDEEILIELMAIGGDLQNHDLHDKIILASAISLQCGLITTDEKLIRYIDETKVIPLVIN